ncbi:MAG: PqqD family protein [Candidatus Omnitrophica bacterium]|nr:PqqD family protein [Candidatus Omnitrophota bacterium]HOX54852.1 PqqD family protein [Candidatus Omnitrophota bacterium]
MKVRQAKDICTGIFPDGLVIFSLKTYCAHALNDSASLIWNFCKKSRAPEEIARFIGRKYTIDYSLALKDAEKFIGLLGKRGLLEKTMSHE